MPHMLFTWKRKRVYLDYASAPPVRPEALAAMRRAEALPGNPGAIHAEGVAAKTALSEARERIAASLNVKPREVVFTSGLSEANNLAVLGLARALERVRRTLDGTHWIVSSIEHASVLECFAEIERLGGSVTHIDPDHRGLLMAAHVAESLRPETVFVSVGWANNEIGVVQPLGDISRAIRQHEENRGTTVLLHADAGQAPLYVPTTAHSLGVDLLSLGSNKLYGPHGAGALYLSNRAELAGLIRGGKQERGLRAGTENVALAAGFAAAYECAIAERESEVKRIRELRDELWRLIAARLPDAQVNGSLEHALPHMLNISIPGIQSEYVALTLDHAGIAVSTKSACHEGEESRSHVVEALGGELWRAQNTLRFSLGRETTRRDVAYAAEALAEAVLHTRS